MRSRQLRGERARGTRRGTGGHCGLPGLRGRHKLGGRCWQEVGRCRGTPGALGGEKGGGLGQGLGGMVFPGSRSHPGKGDGGENRKGKDGQTERQTNVRNGLTQQREGSDKEMGMSGQRDPQRHSWTDCQQRAGGGEGSAGETDTERHPRSRAGREQHRIRGGRGCGEMQSP